MSGNVAVRKKALIVVLAIAAAITLILAAGFGVSKAYAAHVAVKTQATSGVWVKTAQRVIPRGDVPGEHRAHSFEGILDERARFKVTTYANSNSSDIVCETYYECNEPDDAIAPGEQVALNLSMWTKNVSGVQWLGNGSAGIDKPGRTDFISGFNTGFKAEDGTSALDIDCGCYAGKSYADRDASNAMTVFANMPSNPSVGDKASIYFLVTFGGESAYEWEYTFKANTPAKPAKVKLTSVVGKSSAVKATWKKLNKNVTGYQVQFSKKKAFTKKTIVKSVKKAKTSFTSASIGKLKTGAKRFVRVRAFNKSGGQTVYGKWSAVKAARAK